MWTLRSMPLRVASSTSVWVRVAATRDSVSERTWRMELASCRVSLYLSVKYLPVILRMWAIFDWG
jgi:hypothetical protein